MKSHELPVFSSRRLDSKGPQGPHAARTAPGRFLSESQGGPPGGDRPGMDGPFFTYGDMKNKCILWYNYHIIHHVFDVIHIHLFYNMKNLGNINMVI